MRAPGSMAGAMAGGLPWSSDTRGATSRARHAGGLQRQLGNTRINRFILRKCACGGEAGVDGECAACREERLRLQRNAAGAAPSSLPASVNEALNSGGGQKLDADVRPRMEQAFGADLGGVRIHTTPGAARAARDINARAFTVGQDVYFGADQYQPQSKQGQHLLAHELTHTIQQSGNVHANAALPSAAAISHPDEPLEREAEHVATRVMRAVDSGDHEQKQTPPAPTTRPPNQPLIQRDAGEEAIRNRRAFQLIFKHGFPSPDEEDLAADLIPLLPGESALVEEVLNLLPDSDRDDVSYEMVIQMPGRLGNIPGSLRIRMIRELADGVVTDDEEGAIADLWESFDRGGEFSAELQAIAQVNRSLWKKSLWESDQLNTYVWRIQIAFGMDVLDVARAYLAGNKEALVNEALKYGIDLHGQQSVSVPPGYMDEVRALVPFIIKLRKQLDDLRDIQVGYVPVSDCLIGSCKHPRRFDPERPPAFPPDKDEEPPWPTWEETKKQYDRLTAVIAQFSGLYPTLYLLIQKDGLAALDNAGDAITAHQVVHDTFQKTYDKIGEAQAKVGDDITYYDLQLLHTQLFAGQVNVPFEPRHSWHEPFFEDIAKNQIREHEAREFWISLGLSLIAAAALIAAPFTGGATAAFLVGFGIGIGAAQAGMSWDKYLDLSTVKDATVKEELALVTQGQVDAAFIEAIINTVAVFLDVYGARAATTAAKAGRESIELAEKALKDQVAEQVRKQALRGAAHEAAFVGGGSAIAVIAHALGDAEEAPTFSGEVQHKEIDLPPDSEPASTPVTRFVIFRQTGGGAPPAGGTPPPINLTGTQFEIHVERALLSGPMPPLPQMSFVIPGQYTGSGWGIDRIGIVFDEATGAVKVYHLEMKWVASGSPHVPELGTPLAGTQTGEAWTKKAVDGFITSQHPKARAGRERLRRAMQKMFPGEVITNDKMRSFLSKKLVDAPVHIITPPWADLTKLYKQVAGLIRWGRKASVLKHLPK